MDMKKIFLKDACPTTIGGQAIMEGIMMRGAENTAVAIRLPNGDIHIKLEKSPKMSSCNKLPIIRGVGAFFSSLVQGTRHLMYSAEILEAYDGPYYEFDEDSGKILADITGKTDNIQDESGFFERWITEKFGQKVAWNLMLYFSVFISLIVSIGIFVVGPTIMVSWLKHFIENSWALNFIEGIVRLVLFIGYVLLISKMSDIKKLFQYHGAEHECIHCFENGLELTPDNCKGFYTLHPRCGTSFLMFVMVISLVLFSVLGWPNLIIRVVSRIILIPLVAGLSYEVLKWAGRSDSMVVKILSMPGLYLQKITTKKPTKMQLEVAIAAMKAVLDKTPIYGEGICNKDGRIIRDNEFISSRYTKIGRETA